MATATSSTTAEQLWEENPSQRCELVRGVLRMMSPAGSEHGWIVMNIAGPMSRFVRENKLGFVFGAETGFIIERNPDTVRAPDAAFVQADRVKEGIPKTFFPGPPDLAVEVLSPGDTASEVDEKAEDWLDSGCKEVWLIDPRRKTATSCTRSEKSLVRTRIELLITEQLPGFELPLADVFEG